MTVKGLKIAMENLPDDMDVMICQYNDEYGNAMVEKAEIKPIQFQDEEIPEDEWATVECFVLTDEF